MSRSTTPAPPHWACSPPTRPLPTWPDSSYFGSYPVQVGGFANLGFVILGAIAALVWYRREMLGRPFALLAALWAVACVLAVVRVPASDLHPFLAGPRYFFYPYVLMTWACLWLASLSDWRVKVAMTGAYMF